MCGIAGFAGEGSREDVVAMNTALAHRGPDGEATTKTRRGGCS